MEDIKVGTDDDFTDLAIPDVGAGWCFEDKAIIGVER